MHQNRQNIDALHNLLKKKIGDTEATCLLDTLFYLFDRGNKVGSIEMYPVKPSKEFLQANRLLLCDGRKIPKEYTDLLSLLQSDTLPDYRGMFLRGNKGDRIFTEKEDDQYKEHNHGIQEDKGGTTSQTITVEGQKMSGSINIDPIEIKGNVDLPDMKFEIAKAKIKNLKIEGTTTEAGSHSHTAKVVMERNHKAGYSETNLKSGMMPDGFGSRRAYMKQLGDVVHREIEYKDEFNFQVQTDEGQAHSHQIKIQQSDIDLDLDIRKIEGKELPLQIGRIHPKAEIGISDIEGQEIEVVLEIPSHGHTCDESGGKETRPVNMPVYYYIHY